MRKSRTEDGSKKSTQIQQPPAARAGGRGWEPHSSLHQVGSADRVSLVTSPPVAAAVLWLLLRPPQLV